MSQLPASPRRVVGTARGPRVAVVGILLALCGCDAASLLPEASPLDASAPVDAAWLATPDGSVDAASALDAEAQAVVPSGRVALCQRAADDAVRDVFCKGARLEVASLRELLARLHIDALPVDMDEASAAALRVEGNVLIETLALLGHSTALSGQLVSPLNPRAILLNQYTQVAFQRGIQKVEIATLDRQSGRRNLYLLSFSQACNVSAQRCLPGDLYTLAVERDWTAVVLEDDEDLKNTPRDCRQCHQRKRAEPTLLMREFLGPWPHFFFIDSDEPPSPDVVDPSGREIARDYLAAKGTESYAGVPSAWLRRSAGVTLQKAMFTPQTLQFDPSIPFELDANEQAGTGRRSTIWDEAFAAFKRGEQLALPYYEQRPTDPTKLAVLTEAYARYRRGELAAALLPDLSDIFPDDPQTRAEIGLQSEPAATPAQTLVQACGSCHNDVLDQTITRAKFNIALSRMSREELDLAIERIMLPVDDDTAMPPKGMRQLDPAGKLRLIDYLRANVRSAEDDALLDAAAVMGMAKDHGGYAGM